MGKEDLKNDEELVDDKQIVIINNIDSPQQEELRSLTLYGDINEKVCADAVTAILYLGNNSQRLEYVDPSDPESEVRTVSKPIDILISTRGGSASEMFAVYDTMRHVRNSCDISTFGVGKVMSAGVLILAAGTKGKRKIGSNCRVMIHGVLGAFGGSLTSMENEIEEIKWMQEQYLRCLARETNLTVTKLKKMLKRQVDVYLSAEEAVEFGIADEIV